MTALKMTVLIVDDDVFSRMMLMHLIARCGQSDGQSDGQSYGQRGGQLDIIEAEDGLDAWQQLESGLLPAILFCDVRMPRLSGIELLQRVKRDPVLHSVPFVMVSTASEEEAVQHAIASGACGYIVKPFQADRVQVDVRAMLELARARA